MTFRKMALIGLAFLSLSACNTIGGVGQDISAGADKVAEIF
ncbi:MAG: entericidin [Rhodobacter sp.]|nr:entericidin [Rhodobacter sp.]